MGDLMKQPESRGKLALGASGIVAGIAVWAIMGFVAGAWYLPLVVGALTLWGSWRLFQKPSSAMAGMLGLAAGALVTATALPIIGPLAGFLLGLGGFGLFAGGVLAVFQVFRSRRR